MRYVGMALDDDRTDKYAFQRRRIYKDEVPMATRMDLCAIDDRIFFNELRILLKMKGVVQ